MEKERGITINTCHIEDEKCKHEEKYRFDELLGQKKFRRNSNITPKKKRK